MEGKKKKKLIKKLKHKYRLIIFNDEELGEELSFTLSPLNVLLVVMASLVLTILLTIFVITYTPVRKYLPGSSYEEVLSELQELKSTADSLHYQKDVNELYIQNIQAIINGEEPVSPIALGDTNISLASIDLVPPSEEDSLLREKVEEKDRYNVNLNRIGNNTLANYSFFTPVNGIVSSEFSSETKHFGIDILSAEGTPVKATLDGTVIYAEWSVENGYVIAIQHKNDLLSIYKHNSSLLKSQGEYVESGDPIAIIGNSGEQSTGPHLHFELWYENVAVNPLDYLEL